MRRMVLLLAAVCFAAVPQVFAVLINPGFETGDLSGWAYSTQFGDTDSGGNVSVVGTDIVTDANGQTCSIAPVEGAKMLKLSYAGRLTQNDNTVFYPEGADTFSFRYLVVRTFDVDTNIDPDFSNNSINVILNGSDPEGGLLGGLFDVSFPDAGDNGWKYFEARPVSETDGPAFFTLDSFEVYTYNYDHVVYMDDFKINNSNPTSPVPEPNSLFLLAMGLPGLIGIKGLVKKR